MPGIEYRWATAKQKPTHCAIITLAPKMYGSIFIPI